MSELHPTTSYMPGFLGNMYGDTYMNNAPRFLTIEECMCYISDTFNGSRTAPMMCCESSRHPTHCYIDGMLVLLSTTTVKDIS